MDRARAWWRAASPFAVPALVFLGICLVMFWRLWTPLDGLQRTFGWDAQWEYWGDLEFQIAALRDGEWPLWNPYDRTGYPFHADPQTGLLYPGNWPLTIVGLVHGGAPWWLIAVKIAMHFWWAGLGVYFFLRRRGNPPASCYVGGLLLILSYPFVHNLFSALNWSFAWAPWALLAVDYWAEEPRISRGSLVALALAMSVLAGGMASFWYGLLVIVPYGAWAVVHAYRASGDRRRYLRSAAKSTLVAGALFAAIVLAQLSATAALVDQSVRAERDLSFFGFSVLQAKDMIGFFLPRMVGENTYLSFVAIVWMAVLASARPSPRTLVLLGALVLGVLCAWGDRGAFLPFGASILEPFSFFRRAHRYLYVAALPFAILAAEGLTYLHRLDDAERGRLVGRFILGGCSLVILICGVAFFQHLDAENKNDQVQQALGLGVLVAIVAVWLSLMVLRSRGVARQRFLWLCVVVVGVDLWFARGHVIDRNMKPVPRPSRDAEVLALGDVPLGTRIYDNGYLMYRPGLRLQIRDFGGYEDDPLSLRRYASFLKVSQASVRRLAHAGVGNLFEEGAKVRKKTPADLKALEAVGKGVWRIKNPAPSILWFDRAEVVDGGHEAALQRLLRAEPGTVAVLESETLSAGQRERAGTGNAAPVAGVLTHLGRNTVTAEVEAPDDGIVIVHEAFFPTGWQVTVDGEPAEMVPANGLFRGVFVSAGKHVIEMRYHAAGYQWLVLVEILALVVALGLWLLRRRYEDDDVLNRPPDDASAASADP